jgi:hypothetical protein
LNIITIVLHWLTSIEPDDQKLAKSVELLEAELESLITKVKTYRESVPTITEKQITSKLEQDRASLPDASSKPSEPVVNESDIINAAIFSNFETNLKETASLLSKTTGLLQPMVEKAKRINVALDEHIAAPQTTVDAVLQNERKRKEDSSTSPKKRTRRKVAKSIFSTLPMI